ncbi:MAG: UvrD-helicase domain-containing protein [Candidatus Hatepunaea meridiana]|nr:UvrD-helicase domain-containing protein [Candidatus Hatepunaea meridiana]
MIRKLIIACAGAGKTHRIVEEAIQNINSGSKVLTVTYTENNQAEITKMFKQLGGVDRDKFNVKGLFTFLLEDIIRPYQCCIFKNRIENFNFNDSDPHKDKGRTIPGRSEKNSDGSYKPIYYLTSSTNKVHTTYLAKLATKVIEESNGKPISRLGEIYSHIYFDEVQDLVGWDYEVLKALAKSSNLDITCVGDFRQTIYDSAITQKLPKTSEKKKECFSQMNFDYEHLSINRRSIQCICDIADSVHVDEGYESTKSLVEEVPERYIEHTGVFIVKESDSNRYVQIFRPTLLRHSISSGKKFNQMSIGKFNFGKSKGMGFDRVLVLPTPHYIDFLKGNKNIFDKDKTDKSKNKLYVAMTRARYSLAFVIPDKDADECNLPVWNESYQSTTLG